MTFSGSWRYLEYPEVNTAGSYLYEPAGSIHTLHVPPTNRETTDVWFAIRGANLNLDEQGNVESVWDAAFLIVSGRGVLPGADPGLVVDARNDLRERRAQRAPRRLGGDARVSCGEPRTERASGRRVDAVTHATPPARRLLQRRGIDREATVRPTRSPRAPTTLLPDRGS